MIDASIKFAVIVLITGKFNSHFLQISLFYL